VGGFRYRGATFKKRGRGTAGLRRPTTGQLITKTDAGMIKRKEGEGDYFFGL